MAQQLSRYESVISEMTSGTEARQERPRSAWRALGYDLGLLHTKVIKSVFCCLTDSQQIGKYINNSLVHSDLTYIIALSLFESFIVLLAPAILSLEGNVKYSHFIGGYFA